MVMVNLINNPTVIPETYIQFPDMLPPSLVYGGLWNAVFDDEGIFFRTGGGEALPFNGGLQLDELKAHTHMINSGNGEGNYYNHNARHARDVSNQNTSSTGGVETRPRNRTFRVWKRVI